MNKFQGCTLVVLVVWASAVSFIAGVNFQRNGRVAGVVIDKIEDNRITVRTESGDARTYRVSKWIYEKAEVGKEIDP